MHIKTELVKFTQYIFFKGYSINNKYSQFTCIEGSKLDTINWMNHK